jgi:hypothetical protein
MEGTRYLVVFALSLPSLATSAMSIPPKNAQSQKKKRGNHVVQVKSVQMKRKEIVQRVESLEQRVQELVCFNLFFFAIFK